MWFLGFFFFFPREDKHDGSDIKNTEKTDSIGTESRKAFFLIRLSRFNVLNHCWKYIRWCRSLWRLEKHLEMHQKMVQKYKTLWNKVTCKEQDKANKTKQKKTKMRHKQRQDSMVVATLLFSRSEVRIYFEKHRHSHWRCENKASLNPIRQLLPKMLITADLSL